MNRRFWLFSFTYLLLIFSATSALENVNAALAAGERLRPEPGSQPASGTLIRSFDLLTPNDGWLLIGQQLFWSEDGGTFWRTITPPLNDDQVIADVTFLGKVQGRVVLAEVGEPMSYLLGLTVDGGERWQVDPLHLFAPDEPAVNAETIEQFWLDAQTGWLVIRRSTSSNFSKGFLFRTDDGGDTWTRLTTPAAQAVVFRDRSTGWTLGHPSTGTLFRTHDGGLTWTVQPLFAGQDGQARIARVYLPQFGADRAGALLPILTDTATGQHLEWLVSTDGGNQWAPFAPSAAVEGASDERSGQRSTDPYAWLMERSEGQPRADTGQIVPFRDGGITRVRMASSEVGWAQAEVGGPLLRTTDGGRTWTPLNLPGGNAERFPDVRAAQGTERTALADTVARTSLFTGAGFDICDLPERTQLRTWRNESPYGAINLYLGGVLRFCDNEELTADRLRELAAEGWKFIPTWVGPQAPCSDYRSRFSINTLEAFDQGAAEAAAALTSAKALGLTLPEDRSGTIIYYDMESFDTKDEGCIEAAKAFVSGWSDHLHRAGSQSGLYGSACLPRMDTYAGIANPPDAIWVASWIGTTYDPSFTVWDIPCLANTLWNQGQRIRQYTGGHDETWGEITFNIDSNVLMGLVADPAKSDVMPEEVVTLEEATLQPLYDGDLCSSAWHGFTNVRGYPAYLTLNRQSGGTIPPITNEATWEASLPVTGQYRVEAFIPAHPGVSWICPERTIEMDTSSALYTIEHALGQTSRVTDQNKYRDMWLDLGTYPFEVDTPARVHLSDETKEAPFTRAVSASAMRFTPVTTVISPTTDLFLPVVIR